MPLAADYPLLDIVWTMLCFFGLVLWIGLLFQVLGDVFRREDASAGKKVAWSALVIFLPLVGVLAYLATNGADMAARDADQRRAAQAQLDDYVRSVSNGNGNGAAAEIEKAEKLRSSGAISDAEFAALKAQALA